MLIFRSFRAVLLFLLYPVLFLSEAAAEPCPSRTRHACVVFQDKLWIIGGWDETLKNDVWSSLDGINWTQVTAAAGFSPRDGHASLIYKDKLWVIGGYDGKPRSDVWCSSDGVSWTEATPAALFSPRSDHASVVYDGKMWVIGGSYDPYGHSYGDVWWSEDGYNWNEVTRFALYGSRLGHSCLVFNDRIWMLGGCKYTYFNDIWRTRDGKTWEMVNDDADFAPRASHGSVVFDGKMWVLGGWDGSGYNDVWWSADGAHWQRHDRDLKGNVGGAAVVFKEKIWVIGGYDGKHALNNISLVGPRAPQISVSPPELLFTAGSGYAVDLRKGESYKERSLVISNTGSDELVVTGLTLSGTHAARFTISPPPVLPLKIASLTQTTLTVRFKADGNQVGENMTAQLSIASNDPANPTVNVALAGDVIETEVNAVEDWSLFKSP